MWYIYPILENWKYCWILTLLCIKKLTTSFIVQSIKAKLAEDFVWLPFYRFSSHNVQNSFFFIAFWHVTRYIVRWELWIDPNLKHAFLFLPSKFLSFMPYLSHSCASLVQLSEPGHFISHSESLTASTGNEFAQRQISPSSRAA